MGTDEPKINKIEKEKNFQNGQKWTKLRHLSTQKWEVTTQEGERLTTNFLIDGGGRFHVPHIPDFKGQLCHLASN